MALEQTDLNSAITDDSVLGYLKRNPEFFVHNQDILSRLRVPHDSGGAVSLIEKQVSVMRARCGHLENSLRDLIAVARENENLHQRLHSLIQQIISVSSIEEITALTQNSLRENFNAEDVHILLIEAAPKRTRARKADSQQTNGEQTANVKAEPAKRRKAQKPRQFDGATVVAYNDKRIKPFGEVFNAATTQCGMPSAAQLTAIVGDEHAHVASAAIIPLHFQRKLGLIMLTSRDETRFASGRGVMFLDQMGELISRRVHSYGPLASRKTSMSAGTQ